MTENERREREAFDGLSAKLWCDLRTDEERSAWLLLGRGHETGVVARALQNDLAMAYHRLALLGAAPVAQDERARFVAWADERGYDIAYTYDTERSRWVFLNPMTADLWECWQARAALSAATPPAVSAEALDMLALMFDAYEDGTACYEDPEERAGYLGRAVKLDHATFHRIADLLNEHCPRAAMGTQPAADNKENGK